MVHLDGDSEGVADAVGRLSLSRSLALSLSLSLTRTHTHTHTPSLPASHPPSLSLVLALPHLDGDSEGVADMERAGDVRGREHHHVPATRHQSVLNLGTTTSQKCAAVPGRARI